MPLSPCGGCNELELELQLTIPKQSGIDFFCLFIAYPHHFDEWRYSACIHESLTGWDDIKIYTGLMVTLQLA